MFCSNCGAKVEENAKFCRECGSHLAQAEESSIQAQDRQSSGGPAALYAQAGRRSGRRVFFILVGAAVLIAAIFLVLGNKKNPEDIIPGTWYAPEGDFYQFDGEDVTFYSDGRIEGWALKWKVLNGNLLYFDAIYSSNEYYYTIVRISSSRMTLRDRKTGETVTVRKR